MQGFGGRGLSETTGKHMPETALKEGATDLAVAFGLNYREILGSCLPGLRAVVNMARSRSFFGDLPETEV